jgi:hypothetical protein
MPSTSPLLRRAVALAGLCLAIVPAAASADSIVYVKSGNVWLSQPDGSGAYQVTTDGTADSPYRSPSQADDGTIAVGHDDDIVRMDQNGSVRNRIDPPGLTDSVSHHMDGPPVDVAISPDGARIAYTLAGYSCPPGADCGARTATAYTAADHFTAPEAGGTTYFRNPSWVTNARTVQFGGAGSQVNLHDVGSAGAKHWFDDYDYADPPTDLGDGEVSRQGSDIALLRGYGDSTTLIWYRVTGDVRAGSPGVPDIGHGCATGQQAGTAGPTWSPDGTALAWEERNQQTGQSEIWVKRQAADCTVQPTPSVVGGSEPDWGPANVAPAPRGTGQGSQGGTATGRTPAGGGGGTTVTANRARLLVAKPQLAKALRSGLKVRLEGAQAGRVTLVAKRGKKIVARGSAKVGKSGAATVTLRFTKAAKRSLRSARSIKLKLSGGGTRASVTLKR